MCLNGLNIATIINAKGGTKHANYFQQNIKNYAVSKIIPILYWLDPISNPIDTEMKPSIHEYKGPLYKKDITNGARWDNITKSIQFPNKENLQIDLFQKNWAIVLLMSFKIIVLGNLDIKGPVNTIK